MTQDHRLSTIRRVIVAVLMLGMGGLLAELALIAHYEDVTQWIPIALLAVGLVVLGADLVLERGWTQLLMQLTMALLIAAGLLGVYFHFQGSREFQVEMDPQMRGTTLVWHVLRAKSPPTLAPGSMVQLGILGLGYAYLRRVK
jgi:cation transport ATPase